MSLKGIGKSDNVEEYKLTLFSWASNHGGFSGNEMAGGAARKAFLDKIIPSNKKETLQKYCEIINQ